MDSAAACLAYGAAISFVVSLLKKVALVKQYPKIAAFVLSAIVTAAITYFGDNGSEWQTIAKCVVIQFATAVTTHETVVQPIKDNVT